MLIVGSKGLLYNFPDMEREVNDIDIISSRENALKLVNTLNPVKVIDKDNIIILKDIRNKSDIFTTNTVEILISDNSQALRMYLQYDNYHIDIKFASKEVLYSMKKSHINFPGLFKKHISDYYFLNNHFNGIDILENITKIHYKETEGRIGQLKTPSLNKPVKDFFKQSDGYVKSYFIHDDIHKAVSHYNNTPLYLNMQKDTTIAMCNKDMWDKFTYEDKCKCILEEAYVISLERKILPSLFNKAKWVSSKDAFDWSLMRICTNLCSGWFRQFATDNYYNILKYFNELYVDEFLVKYNNGDIKKL